MNATARRRRSVKMTIEVFTVHRHGHVIEDWGTVVAVRSGKEKVPATCAWPPCACPRHRAARVVRA
ncbi:hypothetical protein [Streptomyces sp. NPDC052012]|uniref:hypothetical protein n=1 Tax=Streptomyces sp. NPDC052012 TaxID=3155051 RepID=UPI00344FF543